VSPGVGDFGGTDGDTVGECDPMGDSDAAGSGKAARYGEAAGDGEGSWPDTYSSHGTGDSMLGIGWSGAGDVEARAGAADFGAKDDSLCPAGGLPVVCDPLCDPASLLFPFDVLLWSLGILCCKLSLRYLSYSPELWAVGRAVISRVVLRCRKK
jgi:hypothetical protein